MQLVCAKYMDGFTEHTQLVNLEEIANGKKVEPSALLKHLSVTLSTGVKCVGGKWLVKGRHTEATLQCLLDTYALTCRDCSRPATYGTRTSGPSHCRTHRDVGMVLNVLEPN
jgi:hypothetical protein